MRSDGGAERHCRHSCGNERPRKLKSKGDVGWARILSRTVVSKRLRDDIKQHTSQPSHSPAPPVMPTQPLVRDPAPPSHSAYA